jgi:hypothetical protein
MDDGAPSNLGPLERLQILKEHQRAWEELAWKDVQFLRMREKWVCRGGVLTHISMHWPRCVITARQLPSVLRGIEERVWTLDVGLFWILTFGIGPSQDLFLAIEPVLALCVLSLHLCYTTLI